MLLAGKITLSRSSGGGDDCMRLSIVDAASRIEFISVEFSLEEYANIITAHGFRPCKIDVRGLDLLGKTAENKTENVPIDGIDPYKKSADLAALADKAAKDFLVDGWMVQNPSDVRNHHRHIKIDGRNFAQMSFVRYVDSTGA